jgi:uncharacterized protein YqhQ
VYNDISINHISTEEKNMSTQKSNSARKKKPEKKYYGGQAVMEGVMMRGTNGYAMAVRKPDGDIAVEKKKWSPAGERLKFLKWPLLRGVVSFVESLVLGMKTLMRSAELAGLEDIEESEDMSRFERFLTEKLGDKLGDVIIYFSVALALVVSLLLFMLLPAFVGGLFGRLISEEHWWALGIIEGVVRMAIFIAYMYLISLSKELRRVFQYHGAEHKTINCFEAGDALTVENARRHTRLHRRCGTSFLLIVMIISMIFFIFVKTNTVWLRFATRILFIPLIAGVSYEVIRWAGRSDGPLVRLVSYPGMMLQKISTAEPDDGQIETAIAALKGVLEDEPGASA